MNKTFKTKLSFKAVYNLGFQNSDGKRPSCSLSIELDLAWRRGFYKWLKFVPLSAAINMTFLNRYIHTLIWTYIRSSYDVHPYGSENRSLSLSSCPWVDRWTLCSCISNLTVLRILFLRANFTSKPREKIKRFTMMKICLD